MIRIPESVVSLAAPWEATLTDTQHQLISSVLAFAAVVFLAGLVQAITTRREVSARYRLATVAQLGIMVTTSVIHVAIIVAFIAGYDYTQAGWVPNQWATETFAVRYVEWAVTAPLLCLQLLAVTTLLGATADRTRFLVVAGALGMVGAGYLGAVIIDGGQNPGQTLLWFAVSTVLWLIAAVLITRAVRSSVPQLTAEAGRWLKAGAILLLGGWLAYPTVSLIQVFAAGGEWTTTMHIGFTLADVTVKIGVAGIIHRVAKLRTAEDIRAGDDMHPESIWISSIKQSDAGVARVVYLADGASVHPPRREPAGSAAQGFEEEPESFAILMNAAPGDEFD